MDDHGVEVDKVVNAKKETIGADDGLALALKSKRIYAAKGKKIVEFATRAGRLHGEASEEDLRKAIIGPSGNLRAPSLWVGSTLYVGFHPEMYARML